MKSAQHNKSEVARLLESIQEEYESAMLGVQGISSGSATHQVISQKMARMCELQEELRNIVGPCATMMIDLQLQNCPAS